MKKNEIKKLALLSLYFSIENKYNIYFHQQINLILNDFFRFKKNNLITFSKKIYLCSKVNFLVFKNKFKDSLLKCL